MTVFKRFALTLGLLLAAWAPLSAFKVPIHLEITRTALKAIAKTVGSNTYEFTDKAIEEVMKANQKTDECVSCQFHSEYHFDGEDISNGSKRLVDLKNQILADLSGSSPNGAKAREHLGQALHTLQDFFAHSTRVESGLSSLDAALGVSTFSGVGKTTATCLAADAAKLAPGFTGLTSGYFPLPSPCSGSIPANKCRHGNDEAFGGVFDICNGINKDSPSRPNYQTAHDLAGAATDRYVRQLILNDSSITNNAKAVKALMGIGATLGMVIDTTGSMGGEIDAVKSNIASIVSSVVGTPDEPGQYLLTPFNDPGFGPTTASSDAPTFLSQVNALFASGGGDCPELAMGGLLDAVNAADQDSTLFLFTDASAKDSSLAGNVSAAAVAKKVTINYALFGSCSPIDPAYITTASATGGQVFLLNRFSETNAIFPLMASQVGGDEVNIAHAAGTLVAGREVRFPVDSMIRTLTVSVSMDAVSSIVLTRPDGSVVAIGDPGATVTRVSGGAIFVLTDPPPGAWMLRLQGSGAYSVDVHGKTSHALSRQVPAFTSFEFVTRTGRLGHEGYFAIPGQPILGEAQTVVARINGLANNVSFQLIGENGDLLQPLALTQGDPDAMIDDFVGSLSPPPQSFRILAAGVDANGLPFQRIRSGLSVPTTVKVTPRTFLADGLPQGQSVSLVFQVDNLGPAGSFSFAGHDGQSFVTSVSPAAADMLAGGSTNVTVALLIPASAPKGTNDSVTLVATSAADSRIQNSAVQTFEVSAGDSTGPSLAASPNPEALWPPNGKSINVTISGTVTDTQSGVNRSSGQFSVTDEYGAVQPSGPFAIEADGTFSFTVALNASRLGTDADGRVYSIELQASDTAGNVGTTTVSVVVPHDQGRR